MRTLLIASVLGLTACPRPLEVCGDGVDNDGDELVDAADSDCTDVITDERCDDQIDNDGDTIADCDDADCFLSPSCLTEDCTNDRDDDLDELVDCRDDDCIDAPTCQGALVWALSGEGTASTDRSNYIGRMWMTDTVLDNDAGFYNVGDILCEAEYDQLSTGSPSVPCPDCDWALAVGPSTYRSHAGPECDTWYDFTNPSSANYYGIWYFPEAIGYASSYDGGATQFPAAMFLATVENDQGQIVTEWYAWAYGDDMSWDEATGALTWRIPIGYFSYN